MTLCSVTLTLNLFSQTIYFFGRRRTVAEEKLNGNWLFNVWKSIFNRFTKQDDIFKNFPIALLACCLNGVGIVNVSGVISKHLLCQLTMHGVLSERKPNRPLYAPAWNCLSSFPALRFSGSVFTVVFAKWMFLCCFFFISSFLSFDGIFILFDALSCWNSR